MPPGSCRGRRCRWRAGKQKGDWRGAPGWDRSDRPAGACGRFSRRCNRSVNWSANLLSRGCAMQNKRFFPALWALMRPYWVSEQRGKGLILLATVVGLALMLVWLEVQFNTWNREFYNTFESRDQAEFYRQLGMFTILAFMFIITGVYKVYFQQMLLIEWRTW